MSFRRGGGPLAGLKAVDSTLAGSGRRLVDVRGKSRGVLALSDISFRLRSGDRLGLVGRNGSGKTTLLRAIAGIYPPEAGFVGVEGRVATLFNIGLGMQMNATGYRNIFLAGLMAGETTAAIKAATDEIAEFTELGDYLDLPVRTYSAGMAMRLKFACATAFNPDVLLLDEWIGAGDKEFRNKAQARMEALVARAGIVVLATHNRELMRAVCDRAIWLDQGAMRMIGGIDQVLDAREASHEPLR